MNDTVVNALMAYKATLLQQREDNTDSLEYTQRNFETLTGISQELAKKISDIEEALRG